MIYVTLGGLPIHLHAGAPSQSYTKAGGTVDLRMANGTLIRQSHWQKETITLSGEGWMGLGFDSLDYTQPLELRCTQPKTAASTSPTIEITGTPRLDAAPWAQAFVGGQWLATNVTLSGTTASCTPVAGATHYRVSWMPKFDVLCNPPTEALDPTEAFYSWEFTAQEV